MRGEHHFHGFERRYEAAFHHHCRFYDKEIIHLFRDVVLVCDDLGLIGKEMFAIDGCKLPSNASKEWSGTRADFEKKAAKMETAIGRIVEKHREQDQRQTEAQIINRERRHYLYRKDEA